jgi:hypothetical protein
MNKKHIGSNFDEWLKEIGEGHLINISACKHFKGIGECEIMEGLCVKNDCYFKECERLKAENEELKLHNNTLVYNCEKFKEGNIILKQALEEIRKIVLAECKFCGRNITDRCALCDTNTVLSKTNEVLKDE